MTMKIICTVAEFGDLVRGCATGNCNACALHDLCKDGEMIEQFISADSFVSDDESKEA